MEALERIVSVRPDHEGAGGGIPRQQDNLHRRNLT